MEEITRKMFDDLAAVAQIGLTPAEADRLLGEMNAQMKIFAQLEAIPLDESAAPMVYGGVYPEEVRAGLREDVVIPFDNTVGIIAQAPHSRGGYIVSPDVAHQKLG